MSHFHERYFYKDNCIVDAKGLKLELGRKALRGADVAPSELKFSPADIKDDMSNWKYRLSMWGSLSDGRKAHVVVDGIPVDFDVYVPRGEKPEDIIDKLKRELVAARIEYISMSIVEGKPMIGYQPYLSQFIRICFTNVFTSSNAMKALKNGYHLYNQFAGMYYRKISARFPLSYGRWLSFPKSMPIKRVDDDFVVIEVNVADLRNEEYYSKYTSLIQFWDIETISPRFTGKPPKGENKDHKVFMISSVFGWENASPEDTVDFCITTCVDIENDRNSSLICCRDQRDMLFAFAELIRVFRPDIETGFNSHDYDWPFLIAKIREFGIWNEWVDRARCDRHTNPKDTSLTAEKWMRWNINDCDKDRGVKIAGANGMTMPYKNIRIPGVVSMDMRTCLLKLNPTAEVTPESSLGYYLKKNGLPPKEDMPIPLMFKYFHTNDKIGLGKARTYNIVDSKSLARLNARVNAVQDHRTRADMTHTSIADTFRCAVGMQITNSIVAEAFAGRIGPDGKKYALFCDMGRQNDPLEEKYDGAKVIQPKRGLEKKRPTFALDFSGLYPSLMITYNLSPENIILDVEKRPTAERFQTLPYTYGGKKFTAEVIEHEGKLEKFGLVPRMLMGYISARKAVKKVMNRFNSIIEVVELLYAEKKIESMNDWKDRCATQRKKLASERVAIEGDKKLSESRRKYMLEHIAFITSAIEAIETEMASKNADGSARYRSLEELFAEARTRSSIENVRQKNIKVLTNSVYGQMGFTLSKFFLLAIAAMVTNGGRDMITAMMRFAVGQKTYAVELIYGDTDSMYLRPVAECFADIDYTAKGWEERVVERAFEIAEGLSKIVNAECFRLTGYKYLNMAFEEVLFPAAFLGKKIYTGIAHENIANFTNPKRFVRGIAAVKQGNANILRIITDRIWKLALDPNYQTSMLDTICAVLREAIENRRQWKYDDFIMFKKYRESDDPDPKKGNKTLKAFMLRIDARHAIEVAQGVKVFKHLRPENGEKFQIVMTNCPKVDYAGNSISIKNSDMMERVENASLSDINWEYYFMTLLAGACAPFAAIEAQFQPDAADIEAKRKEIIRAYAAGERKQMSIKGTDDAIADDIAKLTDAAAKTAAKKYLHDFCAKLLGIDHKVERGERSKNYPQVMAQILSWAPIGIYRIIDIQSREHALMSSKDEAEFRKALIAHVDYTLRKYEAETAQSVRQMAERLAVQLKTCALGTSWVMTLRLAIKQMILLRPYLENDFGVVREAMRKYSLSDSVEANRVRFGKLEAMNAFVTLFDRLKAAYRSNIEDIAIYTEWRRIHAAAPR